MWVNHHRVFRLVRTTDYPFLYWNGFLLLTISFVPFSTALLAGHLTSPEAATATAVYAGTNVVIALAFSGVWGHLRKHPRLLFTTANPDEIEGISHQYRFGPLLYLIAFGLAFVSPAASIAACLALAIFFAFAGLPTFAHSRKNRNEGGRQSLQFANIGGRVQSKNTKHRTLRRQATGC